MKRLKWLSIIIMVISCLMFTLTACGDDKGKLKTTDSSKILVAYFSCTNHTEKIAQYIAQATDGKLYEITPAVEYTAEDLNYNDSNSRATKEHNDDTSRPEISGTVEDMESYDIIYIGYPIWWGEAPKIIYTFLENYDFSGKTIVPFCTSASSGMGNSANHLHNSASGANWLDGMRFSSSSSQSEVEDWISGLNG